MLTESGATMAHTQCPTPTLLDWLDSLIGPGGLAINCLALLPVLKFHFHEWGWEKVNN
jgi:hypothetical protein